MSKKEYSREGAKTAKTDKNGIGNECADTAIAVHRRLDPETMETGSHNPIMGFPI